MNQERDRGIIQELRVLTFFVTYRCNSRCRTCFFWRDLNRKDRDELSLEEIEKIAASMPSFPHLLLSGGEPILRNDLNEIVEVFIKSNRIKTVDLPTNGLLPEKVGEFVSFMLSKHPEILLTVGVSLDGLAETHDWIRGVKGNFERVFETLNVINEIRYQFSGEGNGGEPRLHLYTLTVLSNVNVGEIEQMVEYVITRTDVDGMMFELIRGDRPDDSLSPPSIEQFNQIVDLSLRINNLLYEKRADSRERKLRLSYLKGVYTLQREFLEKGRLPLRCQAGRRLAVLEPDGAVRLCELLEPVGNLRDYNYDFPALWNDTATLYRSLSGIF